MPHDNIWDEIMKCQAHLTKNENDYAVWYHSANLLVKANAIREAYDCYKQAYDLNKEFFVEQAKFVKNLFRAGDYQKAAALNEYRWILRGVSRNNIPDIPCWGGEKLPGKRLFVFTEQGRGDMIQFIRYIPLLRKMIEGEVVLLLMQDVECLLPLLKEPIKMYTSYPDKGVYTIQTPGVSKAIAMFSLMRFLPITADDALVDAPYIFPQSEDIIYWQKFLNAKTKTQTKTKVGLAWAGNPEFPDDKLRSTRLSDLSKLFSLPNISWYSLQKGDAANDAAKYSDSLIDLAPYINNYADTAAIIKNLDLVITVDTSVLHLSGAVGCPTWALLHTTPDWRWINGRNTSQWYHSLRLFRQQKEGSWAEPITNIKNELQHLN